VSGEKTVGFFQSRKTNRMVIISKILSTINYRVRFDGEARIDNDFVPFLKRNEPTRKISLLRWDSNPHLLIAFGFRGRCLNHSNDHTPKINFTTFSSIFIRHNNVATYERSLAGGNIVTSSIVSKFGYLALHCNRVELQICGCVSVWKGGDF